MNLQIPPSEGEVFIKGPITRGLVGFEPSGRVHLGHYLSLKTLRLYAKSNPGFQILILLSDLHARLNNKPDIAENTKKSLEFFKLFLKEAKVLISSTFFEDPVYIDLFLKYSSTLKIRDTFRALPSLVKETEVKRTLLVHHLYTAFQCIDGKYLNADLIVAGLDQRNIYMNVYDKYGKLQWSKPSFHFLPLIDMEGAITSLDKKMSSSKNNVPLDSALYERILTHIETKKDPLFLNFEKNEIYKILKLKNMTQFLEELKTDLEPLKSFYW